MDPQVMALAGTAGTAIVGAMATDGWQRAREGIVELWRRFRPEAADGVAEDFDRARGVLLDARPEDRDVVASALASAWQGQAVGVLLAQPSAVGALEELARSLREAAAADASGAPRITMNATASGQARVNQVGGDQYIVER